jgi:hypothetical protein
VNAMSMGHQRGQMGSKHQQGDHAGRSTFGVVWSEIEVYGVMGPPACRPASCRRPPPPRCHVTPHHTSLIITSTQYYTSLKPRIATPSYFDVLRTRVDPVLLYYVRGRGDVRAWVDGGHVNTEVRQTHVQRARVAHATQVPLHLRHLSFVAHQSVGTSSSRLKVGGLAYGRERMCREGTLECCDVRSLSIHVPTFPQ